MNEPEPAGRRVATDAFPVFSDQEMGTRLSRVRAEMAARNLDAILIYGGIALGTSQGQVNLQWLAGYAPCVEGFLLVTPAGEPTLFFAVPFHVPNAKKLSYVQDIRAGDCLRNVIKRVRELKLESGRIGFVGPGATSRSGFTVYVEQRAVLRNALPDVAWSNETVWFDDLRLIKSEEELALLRRAGAFNDLAHEELFQLLRPGVTPRDLRRAMESLAAGHGATLPFCHVGAMPTREPTGYYPDFYPTDEPIQPGDLVMTEMCMGFGNYWGKLWGSIFVGEPPPEYRRMFDVAAGVHDDLAARLRPGMTGRDVDAFLEPIRAAGLVQPANILVGGWSAMNHAPAMGAMEGSMSRRLADLYRDAKLLPRQTVTLHAWVRIPDTLKGLWVGSSGVITETGYESFNRYPIATLRIAPA